MKSVLFIIEDKESVQFRYRVENVIEAYGHDAKCVVKDDFLVKDLDGVDLLVIERQTAKNNKILSIIKEAKKQKIHVVFDIDDLIFDYKYLHLLKNSAGKSLLYWVGYLWGIRRIAKRVDGFIVTNDFLGKKIKGSFSKPYKVIRNSLNNKQIEKSDRIKKGKKNCFAIGYFSGSPTHKKDFELVQPYLFKFLDTHDDAEVRVVGYMDFNGETKKYIESGRIKISKSVDYLDLLDLMSEVDVNIAPLVVNDFTNCKSELKFFEAAAVETTTIASPTYTFKNAITDGENGFLAESDEWFKKLEYLYKNPEENKKIAKVAREYALKNYTGKVFLKEVEEAYDYFAK